MEIYLVNAVHDDYDSHNDDVIGAFQHKERAELFLEQTKAAYAFYRKREDETQSELDDLMWKLKKQQDFRDKWAYTKHPEYVKMYEERNKYLEELKPTVTRFIGDIMFHDDLRFYLYTIDLNQETV